jgi:hypothetical protein
MVSVYFRGRLKCMDRRNDEYRSFDSLNHKGDRHDHDDTVKLYLLISSLLHMTRAGHICSLKDYTDDIDANACRNGNRCILI